MSSTKEQIQKAAMSAFKTLEVLIGTEKATLRELTRGERDALDRSNYERKPDDSGFAADADGFMVPINPEQYLERWIAATITPAFTVDEIAEWPVSLKRTVCDQAKRVNNVEPAAAVAKNF
jgi:hypothetical protein